MGARVGKAVGGFKPPREYSLLPVGFGEGEGFNDGRFVGLLLVGCNVGIDVGLPVGCAEGCESHAAPALGRPLETRGVRICGGKRGIGLGLGG